MKSEKCDLKYKFLFYFIWHLQSLLLNTIKHYYVDLTSTEKKSYCNNRQSRVGHELTETLNDVVGWKLQFNEGLLLNQLNYPTHKKWVTVFLNFSIWLYLSIVCRMFVVFILFGNLVAIFIIERQPFQRARWFFSSEALLLNGGMCLEWVVKC